MNEKMPDHAIVSTPSGPAKMSLEQWRSQADSSKVGYLARREIAFFKEGKQLPMKEALTAVAYASA